LGSTGQEKKQEAVAVYVGMDAKYIATAVVMTFVGLIGGWDILAQALVILIALDVIAGLAQAWVERKVNSSIMRKGLVRKTCYFMAIVLGVLLDRALFQGQPAFRTLVLSYLCVNEALSVLEHLVALGVPLPRQVKDALQRLEEELDGESSVSSESKQG
jgi:toxin secretion/phage lysis holin